VPGARRPRRSHALRLDAGARPVRLHRLRAHQAGLATPTRPPQPNHAAELDGQRGLKGGPMFARLTLLASMAAVLALAAATDLAHAAAPPDAELLAQYEPLVQFDPLERFLPTKVESFITDADLEQEIDGVWTVVRKNAPPGDLPGVGS